jgi:osmoprotectant transport system permease protein
MNFVSYTMEHRMELLSKVVEHSTLAGVATLAAALIGIPLGVFVARRPAWRDAILGVAGVVQTVPSVAMLALLMIPLGLGAKPAVTALLLYALLPIIVNTSTGLGGVSRSVCEAADAIGLTPCQKLWMVELPLASPIIVAGIRTSAITTMGIATLSSLIGAGGLGDFIFRGLSTGNRNSILLGVVAASCLALLLGALIGWIEKRLRRRLHSP